MTEEIDKEEYEYTNFGVYSAEYKDFKAELKLKIAHTASRSAGPPGFRKFVGKSKGDLYYFANVKFWTTTYDLKFGMHYNSLIEFSYACNSMQGIFQKLKAN